MAKCRTCPSELPVTVGRGRPRICCVACAPAKLRRVDAKPKRRVETNCRECRAVLPDHCLTYCSDRCRFAYRDRHRDSCSACSSPIYKSSVAPKGPRICQPCRRIAAGRRADETAVSVRSVPRPVRYLSCGGCSEPIVTRHPTLKYCSPQCREASRRWGRGKVRGSTKSRGYGYEHQKKRAELAPLVETGEMACCLCGYRIDPGTRWHLDHTPDRSGYRGPAHADCNLRDGARRGNRMRRLTHRVEEAA